MTKILVRTTKAVGYVTPEGDAIGKTRPAVVHDSAFVAQRIASRELKLLGNLKDEATQKDLDKYWVDCKVQVEPDKYELCVKSFLAEFGEVDEAAPPAPPADDKKADKKSDEPTDDKKGGKKADKKSDEPTDDKK